MGAKRDCPKCGARFYDFARDPAVCPKCAFALAADRPTKARRARREIEEEDEAALVVPAAAGEVEEDGVDEADLAADEEAEISLEDADEERAETGAARPASLGVDEDEEEDEDEDVVLTEIDDAEFEIDDEDDDKLLDDDGLDDDDEMAEILVGEDEDEKD